MAIDNVDLQLFQTIYAQNPDKPMEFIQQAVFDAKQALMENDVKIAQMQAEKENQDNKEKFQYVPVDKANFAIKGRAQIAAAIGDDEITCCICGKKMKSLGAHLKRFHHVDPKEYIRVCGYPEGTNLMAKNVLEKSREIVKKALSVRKNKAAAE